MSAVKKTKKKQKPFLPQLYVRLECRPNKDSFILHVQQYTTLKLRNPITMERAEQIFRILNQQSYEAKAEGRWEEVWIVHDPQTGEWRGRETPSRREVFGLERKGARGEQSKGDTLRKRYAHLGDGGMTRGEWEALIAETDNLSPEDSKKRFNVLKAKEIIRLCRITRLWHGAQAEPPNLQKSVPVKPKSQEYRERFGRMPELTHDGHNLEKSEHIAWIRESTRAGRTRD
jgi:hypothetical protein